MKLLFDQNLSPRLVLKLADLFPDSNHVYAVDLDRAQDHEVYEYARREGFMLVTKDADFGELNVLRGFPPKVVGFVGAIAPPRRLRKFFGGATTIL